MTVETLFDIQGRLANPRPEDNKFVRYCQLY